MTYNAPAFSSAPRGMRLHIGLLGRRNAGKSSLINALTGQEVAIVSETPGTTTDPVYKSMELQPLGPVVFIDAPGLDDVGDLGTLRVAATKKVLDKIDIALVVTAPDQMPGSEEKDLVACLRAQKVPYLIILNKQDLKPGWSLPTTDDGQPVLPGETLPVSSTNGQGIEALRNRLQEIAPREARRSTILGDLITPNATVVLVTPCDIEAPAGRLILPQVQTLRDILDHDAHAIVTKEDGLTTVLANLKVKPTLVVTDSQVFAQVSRTVPADVPLTSFSILFARYKGNLTDLVAGVAAIPLLKPGDQVLMAEACTHHPIGDDIGRAKIPRALERIVGGKLNFSWCAGADFPANLSSYRLLIHCGGCMINRREMLTRQARAHEAGIPMVNYGVFLAYAQGILPRTLAPLGLAHMLPPLTQNTG
ncbi:MAG: [FeFe] hydrogenase H-cluster maturation GTPase HydF [Firmicutes bacterium]|nr:[FeFe] hydrogenase H-cluster maturation GTPase HydF [Bacillota bacterium]